MLHEVYPESINLIKKYANIILKTEFKIKN